MQHEDGGRWWGEEGATVRLQVEGAFLIGCPALEAARRPERQQRSGEGVDGLRKMQRS